MSRRHGINRVELGRLAEMYCKGRSVKFRQELEAASVLHYWGKLSWAEIGVAMGIPGRTLADRDKQFRAWVRKNAPELRYSN